MQAVTTIEQHPSSYEWHMSLWKEVRKSRHPGVMDYAYSSIQPSAPGAVYDDGKNGRQRQRAARKLMPKLSAIQEEAALFGHALVFITVEANDHNVQHLYDGTGAAWARAKAAEICSGLPHFWRLEYGKSVGLHLHAIASAEAINAAEQAGALVKPVFDLYGLAQYLCKPRDARAALANHQRRQDFEDYALAIRAYLTARYDQVKHRGPRAKLPSGQGFELRHGLCVVGQSSRQRVEPVSSTADTYTPTPEVIDSAGHGVNSNTLIPRHGCRDLLTRLLLPMRRRKSRAAQSAKMNRQTTPTRYQGRDQQSALVRRFRSSTHQVYGGNRGPPALMAAI